MGNPNAVQDAISDRVNQLYGSNVFGSFAAIPSSIPAPVGSAAVADTVSPFGSFAAVPSSIPAPVSSDTAKTVPKASVSHNPAPPQHVLSTQVTDHPKEVQHAHPHPHPTFKVGSSGRPNHGLWDWTARIEFKKYELSTSFSALVFLGQVPENPQDWRTSPNYVGAVHAFVNSAPGRCANCTNQANIVVEGFVHLNHAIVRLSGLTSLEPNVIEPYLTDALQWRVQKVLVYFFYYIC